MADLQSTPTCDACGMVLDRGWQGNSLSDKKYCSPECPPQQSPEPGVEEFRGKRGERARIVAWLRGMVAGLPDPEECLCHQLDIAEAIERGDHCAENVPEPVSTGSPEPELSR